MDVADWAEGVSFAPQGCLWAFPEERVLFTRVEADTADPADAHALVDVFLWLMRELPDPRDPVVVHDWRTLRSIPRHTRQVFLARRHELTVRPARLIVAADINPVLRLAVRSVVLVASVMSISAPMEFVDDPMRALHDLGVVAPDPALHARLRSAWRMANQRSVRP